MKKLMIVICGLFFFPFKVVHASQSTGRYHVRICSYYSTNQGQNPYTRIDVSENGTTSHRSSVGVSDWTHVADVGDTGAKEMVFNASGILSNITACLNFTKLGYHGCMGSNNFADTVGSTSTEEFSLGKSFTSTVRRLGHLFSLKRRQRIIEKLQLILESFEVR